MIRMNPQDVEIVEALGHLPAQLETTPGGRFIISCACGYASTTRRTRTDALGALMHHLALALKEYHRNGVSLPRSVGASR